MISVFEMLPISRCRVGLSTTGKRSDRVSENFLRASPVLCKDDIEGNFRP